MKEFKHAATQLLPTEVYLNTLEQYMISLVNTLCCALFAQQIQLTSAKMCQRAWFGATDVTS